MSLNVNVFKRECLFLLRCHVYDCFPLVYLRHFSSFQEGDKMMWLIFFQEEAFKELKFGFQHASGK